VLLSGADSHDPGDVVRLGDGTDRTDGVDDAGDALLDDDLLPDDDFLADDGLDVDDLDDAGLQLLVPDPDDPDADLSGLDVEDLEHALNGLVTILLETVSTCRRPLDAELAVCEGFGPVDELAPPEATTDERDQMRSALAAEVVARAARIGSPDALALLRACAVIVDPSVRSGARAAADDLAAAGVVDKPWARAIGSPTPVRAWRYGDLFGSQESVCVMFDYAHREHVAAVLIDHRLGGGVKDVWLSDGRAARTLRSTMGEAMAGEASCYIDDIDLAEAGTVLRAALAESVCPEQPDQVQDVAAYLPLLRARVELLPEPVLAPVPGHLAAVEDGARRAPRGVLRLKVALKGTKPPVWRRLEVPSDITLERLHETIQVAFGWSGELPHRYSWPSSAGPSRHVDPDRESTLPLGGVAGFEGDRLGYRYGDGADGWDHVITVEELHRAGGEGVSGEDHEHPRCTGGRRRTPPEGCGGPQGFTRLLAALADPESADHPASARHVGLDFDPAVFDRSAVNLALAHDHGGSVQNSAS
jgi:hypothetical protein